MNTYSESFLLCKARLSWCFGTHGSHNAHTRATAHNTSNAPLTQHNNDTTLFLRCAVAPTCHGINPCFHIGSGALETCEECMQQ